MPTWNPNSYVPKTPGWINNSNEASLTQFSAQIPGLFDTAPMEGAYNNAIQFMLGAQRTNANAAANAFATRQLNAGGNPTGAGFAVGSAMLGAYRRQAEMMKDLEQQKLASRQVQGQLMGQNAAEIARARAARMGMLNDYHLGQQKMYQGQSQFDADQALRAKQLAMQGDQFNKNYSLDQRKFGLMQKDFGLRSDLGRGELDLQRQKFNQQYGYGGGGYGGYGSNTGTYNYGVGNTWFTKRNGWM